jgi:hypothetical protein
MTATALANTWGSKFELRLEQNTSRSSPLPKMGCLRLSAVLIAVRIKYFNGGRLQFQQKEAKIFEFTGEIQHSLFIFVRFDEQARAPKCKTYFSRYFSTIKSYTVSRTNLSKSMRFAFRDGLSMRLQAEQIHNAE